MSDRPDIGSAPFIDPWVQPEFVTAIKVRRMAPGVWSYAQELQRRQDLKKRGIEQLDEPDGQRGRQHQQHLKPQPQQQQQLLHHRSAESTSASAEYRKPSSDPQDQTSTVQAAALDPHLRLNDRQRLRPQVFQSSLQRSRILEAVRTPVPPDVKIPAPALSATAVNAPSFAEGLPASQPASKCSRPSTASQMPIQSNSATLSPFMDNRLSTQSRQAGSTSALSAGSQDVYVRDTAYGFYRIQSDKWQQDGGRTQYTQLGVNAEVENLRSLEAMPSA